jgi:hypothetical protein
MATWFEALERRIDRIVTRLGTLIEGELESYMRT